MMKKSAIVMLLTMLSSMHHSQSELISQPLDEFSIGFPLTKSMMKNWVTQDSAVFLKNRLVLSPQAFDKAGLLYPTQSMKTQNFEVVLDFQINNGKQSPLAHGAMQIYFLRQNPQRTAHEFAKAFNQHFNGFMIEIKENNQRVQQNTVQPQRVHEIYGVLTDKDNMQINEPRNARCKKGFTHGQMKITYKNGLITVKIKDSKIDQDFQDCFSFQGDLNYEKFFFVSSHSGMALSNYHYINSIRTSNLDQTVERSTYERQHERDIKQEAFVKQGHDLLHMKGDSNKNRSMNLESYNRQLLRQSTLYSRLMGLYMANQDTAVNILVAAPKDHTLNEITRYSQILSTHVDTAAAQIQRVEADNFNKVSYLESMSSKNSDGRTDRYMVEERRVEDSSRALKDVLQQFLDLQDSDKLLQMIKQSATIREQNMQEMVLAHEKKSEVKLAQHIKDMMRQRKTTLESSLQEDDIFDWFLMMALVAVAGFGILLWKKLKEQQSILL